MTRRVCASLSCLLSPTVSLSDPTAEVGSTLTLRSCTGATKESAERALARTASGCAMSHAMSASKDSVERHWPGSICVLCRVSLCVGCCTSYRVSLGPCLQSDVSNSSSGECGYGEQEDGSQSGLFIALVGQSDVLDRVLALQRSGWNR
jgi:hypothetical protein